MDEPGTTGLKEEPPWLKIGKQVKKWVNKAVGINWESPGPLKKKKNSNAFHYKNTYRPLASLYLQ